MPWLLNQRALYAAPNCIRHLASHRHGSTVYQTRFHTASAKTSRALNTGRSTQADDVAIADHGHVGGSVPGGTEGRIHLAGVNENCALWRTAMRSPNPDRDDSK